jgi:hypothetical protein
VIQESPVAKRWAKFLSVAFLYMLIWNWLAFVCFSRASSPTMLIVILGVPVVIGFAVSYFAIWRLTKSLAERMLVIILVGPLAFCAAYLVGHLYNYIFPVKIAVLN